MPSPLSEDFERIDYIDAIEKLDPYSNLVKFDWNDYKTFESAKKYIAEVEAFLKDPLTTKAYHAKATSRRAKEMIADLYYRVGTYHNHIKRDPNSALFYLQKAEYIYTHTGSSQELAWTQNHLAFSFQQSLANVKKGKEKKPKTERDYARSAHHYCEEAKSRSCENAIEKIKITAFAECVRALTEYEQGNLREALDAYRGALDLYEKHQLTDDQYARAKNRWAMMLVENKQTEEAGRAFSELEQYWTANEDKSNPYPARFYNTYGDFLLKIQPKLALEKYKKAHQILCVTDGADAGFTRDVLKKMQGLASNYSPRFNKPAPTTSTQSLEQQATPLLEQAPLSKKRVGS